MKNQKALEYLLKDLGWVKVRKGKNDWRYGDTALRTNHQLYTYDFISQIPIEDWEIYKKHLARILGLNDSVGYWVDADDEAFHNTSLDHRILALARARGFHE